TLRALTEAELGVILRRALADRERGLGAWWVELGQDGPSKGSELAPSASSGQALSGAKGQALRWLVTQANGDARVALNALELAAAAAEAGDGGRRQIDVATLQDAMQRRSLQYDKAGDQHFDVISAFIKSIRGSDPDAAIYW